MRKRVLLAIGGTLASIVMGASAVNGAFEAQRGGNHGCTPGEGSAYSDHFFEPGDNIVFGFRAVPGGGFPPTDQEEVRAQNISSEGGTPSTVSCGGAPGTYDTVTSELGPGDDSIRLDGKGIETESGEVAFGPIPRPFGASLRGFGGDDVIRGHKGFDDISGGKGDDVIKADDGKRDVIECNGGKDKADVDAKDDVSGCEKLT